MTLPILKLYEDANLYPPQSHLHFHRIPSPLLSYVFSITVSFPKRSPLFNFIFASCLDSSCKHPHDLVFLLSISFDFYLPDYNLCIEYDGEQHNKIIKYWGDFDGLKDRQKKDNIKNDFCKKNNIKLIRISYLEKDKIERAYIEKILTDIKEKING